MKHVDRRKNTLSFISTREIYIFKRPYIKINALNLKKVLYSMVYDSLDIYKMISILQKNFTMISIYIITFYDKVSQ